MRKPPFALGNLPSDLVELWEQWDYSLARIPEIFAVPDLDALRDLAESGRVRIRRIDRKSVPSVFERVNERKPNPWADRTAEQDLSEALSEARLVFNGARNPPARWTAAWACASAGEALEAFSAGNPTLAVRCALRAGLYLGRAQAYDEIPDGAVPKDAGSGKLSREGGSTGGKTRARNKRTFGWPVYEHYISTVSGRSQSERYQNAHNKIVVYWGLWKQAGKGDANAEKARSRLRSEAPECLIHAFSNGWEPPDTPGALKQFDYRRKKASTEGA